MKYIDIIVIGGGPAGQIAATTAKSEYKDKSVAIITEKLDMLVPCGIPYIFHDLGSTEKNHTDATGIRDVGGELIIDKVTKIDRAGKTLSTVENGDISYDKLIFATGSLPVIPTFIKGFDTLGSHIVQKEYDSMDTIKKAVDDSEKVVVIGGGFVGCEFAEQIAKDGKKVTLIEALPHCLSKSFSDSVCTEAEKALRNIGVDVRINTKVTEITGTDSVDKVCLSTDECIDVDTVIISVGFKPNSELAKNSGLEITNSGAIKVDNYMRTNDENIFAVGDCSSTQGFITGKPDNIMLASTGTAEARILGHNIYNIKLSRKFQGTLGIFSTKIGGIAFTCAGANERMADEANIEYVQGVFKGIDKHPGRFEDTSRIGIKLLASKSDGRIIGAEVWGAHTAGEIINIVGMAIQNGTTVFDLLTYQIGTHPLLTGPPTGYSVIKAAEMIYSKLTN
ncbi:MAG TPA: FAD-dependent oxidoreductase [Caldisericia bacterium]|nr:FAD-dependent oxidoreductase [Caldisericia bacterium]HPF49656.1 FAD-dependent oxidoreductase [Caldisericia bacterium]HPI84639.1 FAD-dependent oxidoreductase [Caldisericia bacterium]HPQ93687.1 FAD-dependent oxidoreductase [Caldisericia bacterium]HRV74750.1 FAD-dependent oxidoreductase [Caldisericia bacterium]